MSNIIRLLSVFAFVTCIASCTTKPVKIVTLPDGAEVSNGHETCTSPCTLEINDKVKYITATLPGGRFRKVEVHAGIADKGDISANISNHAGDSVNLIGASLAVLGLITASLAMDALNDLETEQAEELFSFSAAAWAGGYILI